MDERFSNLDRFRFYAVDDENRRRSDVWFVSSTGDHVYLAPRTLGGALKLSLHPPEVSRDGCDSQWGHTGNNVEAQRASGFRPIPLLRWKRPATPENGTVCVARILFAPDLLTTCDPLPEEGKSKFAFPLPSRGNALQFTVFYSRDAPQRAEEGFLRAGITPVCYLSLSTGEFVNLTAHHVPYQGKTREQFAADSREYSSLSGAPGRGEQIDNARAIVVAGYPERGQPLTLLEVGTMTVSCSDEGLKVR